ncbi:MAG: Glycosyltransferase [uncultured Cytophagales bacterium]|uniref:Glycosyltransferase n=1 Tax=uncultured Cytophagales bacterium TaxID=158755 RepID=A0A6J4JMP1_9SPHI|nr:MAG: Glycosyltransferase [uncultured Cytophagales bacterium]
MPLVSVIIPNYNHARFLERRIESVLGQTFTDMEVILLDDCSSDGSAAILEKYRNHPKVSQVRINAVNSGSTFKQWQTGFSLARGTYLWIAESDDWAAESFLERAVGLLNAHAHVGLVFCQSRIVDDQNVALAVNLARYREPWTKDLLLDGRDALKKYMLKGNVIPNASAVLFRRSLAEGDPAELQSFRYAGDWYFWARLLLRADLAFVNEELNFFRVHGQNVSNKAEEAGLGFIEGFRIVKAMFSRIPGLTPAEKKEISNYWAKRLAGIQTHSPRRFTAPVLLAILKHSLGVSVVFPATFAAYYSWMATRQWLGKSKVK